MYARVLLYSVLITLQVADVLTTTVSQGPNMEANLLLSRLWSSFGARALVVVKIALLLFIAVIHWLVVKNAPALEPAVLIGISINILCYVGIVVWNLNCLKRMEAV